MMISFCGADCICCFRFSVSFRNEEEKLRENLGHSTLVYYIFSLASLGVIHIIRRQKEGEF